MPSASKKKTKKKQRSSSIEAKKKRKTPNKFPRNLVEDVCRFSLAQSERARSYENHINELNYLLPVKQYRDKYIDVPQNFPEA